MCGIWRIEKENGVTWANYSGKTSTFQPDTATLAIWRNENTANLAIFLARTVPGWIGSQARL